MLDRQDLRVHEVLLDLLVLLERLARKVQLAWLDLLVYLAPLAIKVTQDLSELEDQPVSLCKRELQSFDEA